MVFLEEKYGQKCRRKSPVNVQSVTNSISPDGLLEPTYALLTALILLFDSAGHVKWDRLRLQPVHVAHADALPQ